MYKATAGTAIQYSNENNELASGYWLKFYTQNSPFPILMATDSTGATELAKCKLNPDGFPISNPADNDTIFTPYVEEDYRLVIYRTEADADADNTAAAFVNIPRVASLVDNDQIGTGNDQLPTNTTLPAYDRAYATAVILGQPNNLTISNFIAPIQAVTEGLKVRCLIDTAPTGPCTLTVDGLGPYPVKTARGTDIFAGYIQLNVFTEFTFENGEFIAHRRIESDSNANGEWTKFENGTGMMSFHHQSTGTAGFETKTLPDTANDSGYSLGATSSDSITDSILCVKAANKTASTVDLALVAITQAGAGAGYINSVGFDVVIHYNWY